MVAASVDVTGDGWEGAMFGLVKLSESRELAHAQAFCQAVNSISHIYEYNFTKTYQMHLFR
jgi:hypothetical protein